MDAQRIYGTHELNLAAAPFKFLGSESFSGMTVAKSPVAEVSTL
jgi:hypothetical protein